MQRIDLLWQSSPSSLSLGLSLAMFEIHDSIRTSYVCNEYRTPFCFGGDAMPAISATFTMKTRKASDFAELLQIGWEPEKEITDIQLSAHVGRLKVIATPWFFSVAKIGANIVKSVMNEFGLDATSSPRSIVAMRKTVCVGEP